MSRSLSFVQRRRRFTIRLNNVLWLFLLMQIFTLSAAAPGLCRGGEWIWAWSQSVRTVSLWPLWGTRMLWFWTGWWPLCHVMCGIIGASVWWCGTGEGSGPLHGRPDEAMAPSGSARFLAAGLEPVPWLPGSVEGKTKCKGNFPWEILMWLSEACNISSTFFVIWPHLH